ncbi:hypothetical protein Q4567_07870 [Aliiglaciecola sp. 2_MG-2023]|uniref:hypothetical protein n=1 Tax=Aliiglaciecola sp. 1_MG-2023 TaxID=3062640 RepID=UPI0026E3191C|nr:hypothetical protein [Aliiglaciecola sp. 1_MG-2023]MDO6710628.1 hypothetical protein [Aliiglaciecola sp. 2_MG-2023]MDO6754285.1 hypothetical protein [Aliiglaciecola sp. 1_MG-2023]
MFGNQPPLYTPAAEKAGTIQSIALIQPIVLSLMIAVLLKPIVPALIVQFKHYEILNLS